MLLELNRGFPLLLHLSQTGKASWRYSRIRVVAHEMGNICSLHGAMAIPKFGWYRCHGGMSLLGSMRAFFLYWSTIGQGLIKLFNDLEL